MRRARRFTGSLRSLATHRARTLLAVSGVAVGVAAVILASAVGVGAETALSDTVARMGTNLLIIKPVPVQRRVFRPQIAGLATSLRLEDLAAITRLPEISDAAPTLDGPVRVKWGTLAMRTTLRGTTPEFRVVRNFEVVEGRFFSDEEVGAARRVVVLGARVDRELGGGADMTGKEIRIRGVPFEVIGVLRAKGATAEGADQDNQVLVPLSAASRRVFNVPWLSTIYVSVASPELMAAAEQRIADLLRESHGRGRHESVEDFAVQNTARTRGMQQELTRMFRQYAAGVAGIALLVGGLGILALMVLSVRERTREIGLRMAVGAEPRDIVLQFLLEATALSVGGWVVGLLVAGAGAAIVAWGTAWPIGAPAGALAVSFAMAVGIGLGFGVVPARSAARIPPVQALART